MKHIATVKYFKAVMVFCLCVGFLTPSVFAASSKTDKEIIQILIRESIAQYNGVCPCPYSINRGGRKCGRSSAYSKPGGAEPLCYDTDVTEEMIARYRNR